MLFRQAEEFLDCLFCNHPLIASAGPAAGTYLIKVGNHPARKVVVIR